MSVHTTISTNTSRKSPLVDDLFSSTRPLGFSGGDENLKRYVGNSPTNATDPSGLEEEPEVSPVYTPPTTRGNNSQAGIPWFNSQFQWVPGRSDLIKGLPRAEICDTLVKPRTTGITGTTNGTWDKSKMPDGTFAGTAGALTCIGVIVYEPKADGRIVVFHFTGVDSPTATLGNLFTWKFEKGSKAYVFGGNGERASNATLQAVITALRQLRLSVSYIPYDEAWIDKNGNLYVSEKATECE